MINGRVARSPSSRRFAGAMIIAWAGAGLEIAQWAAARPLWLDEEMIAINLRDRSLVDLAGPLWLGQSAPFGWLALQRWVTQLFGTSELALRSVPVLFGLGTLATALWIGRRWMGPLGAAVLVLLCVFGQWITFYALELKPYSADVFWSLLLPALAAWAVEGSDEGRGRVTVWWIVAAVAHWFAIGALLVTPACAAALVLCVWRLHGWRAATRAAAPAFIWAASFGLHWASTLRHTIASDFLQKYWSFALPPASAGVGGTVSWLASQLAPFAVKPGGAGLSVTFWIAVGAGVTLLMRDRFPLALAIALIPVSAFAMAACRLAPLYERLSLWVVPALYVAIATSIDGGLSLFRTGWSQRRWITAGLAAAAVLVGTQVSVDLAARGMDDMRASRPRSTNHELNDRDALRWLIERRQPNDDLMTSHLGLPAVWWYGGVPSPVPIAAAEIQGAAGVCSRSSTTGPDRRAAPTHCAARWATLLVCWCTLGFDSTMCRRGSTTCCGTISASWDRLSPNVESGSAAARRLSICGCRRTIPSGRTGPRRSGQTLRRVRRAA